MDISTMIETTKAIGTILNGASRDAATLTLNLTQLTDDQVTTLVAKAKAVNEAFPEGATAAEKDQIRKSYLSYLPRPSPLAGLQR